MHYIKHRVRIVTMSDAIWAFCAFFRTNTLLPRQRYLVNDVITTKINTSSKVESTGKDVSNKYSVKLPILVKHVIYMLLYTYSICFVKNTHII